MSKVNKYCLVLLFSILMTFTSFAGEWDFGPFNKWWYIKDDGTRPSNEWLEIDGKWYYFSEEGFMLENTWAPDGRRLGADGAWTGVTKTYPEIETEFITAYGGIINNLLSYCQQGNMDGVIGIMDSTDYNTLKNDLPKKRYCYPTENGIGIKIYEHHYLYYGGLVNGEPNGNGTVYSEKAYPRLSGKDSSRFTGIWINGKPNGYGEEYIKLSNGDTINNKGNYVDWFQDGKITSVHTASNGKTYTYEYNVVTRYPEGILKYNSNNSGKTYVTVSPKEGGSAFLKLYDTPQTAGDFDLPISEYGTEELKINYFGYYAPSK